MSTSISAHSSVHFSSPPDLEDPYLALAAMTLRQEHEARRTDELAMQDARQAMIAANERAVEHLLEKASDIRAGALVSLAASAAGTGMQVYGLTKDMEAAASSMDGAALEQRGREQLACADGLAKSGNSAEAAAMHQLAQQSAGASVTAGAEAASLKATGALWKGIGAGLSSVSIVGEKVIGGASATRKDAASQAARNRAETAKSTVDLLKEDKKKSERLVESQLNMARDILEIRHQTNMGIIGRV